MIAGLSICWLSPGLECLTELAPDESKMRFEGLRPNAIARDVLSDQIVAVLNAQWFGSEALELTDKMPSGRVNKRPGTVGFALIILQRPLASSPEDIYQSLYRRTERLQKRLRELEPLATPPGGRRQR